MVKFIFDKTSVLGVPTVSYDYKNISKHKKVRFASLPLSTGDEMCHAPHKTCARNFVYSLGCIFITLNFCCPNLMFNASICMDVDGELIK